MSHTLPPAGTALQSILTAVERDGRLARKRRGSRKDEWGREGSMVQVGELRFGRWRRLFGRGGLAEHYKTVNVREA